MRRRPKPAKTKIQGNQPRAGKSSKTVDARIRDLEKRLAEAVKREAEALEQQTATAEILRIISSSPGDVQPVFETIAATALRLCSAKLCTVFRFDGRLIHLVALHDVSTEGAAAYRDAYPAAPGRAGGTHRAILTGSVVHIRDIREDPEYELQTLARANDFGRFPTHRDRTNRESPSKHGRRQHASVGGPARGHEPHDLMGEPWRAAPASLTISRECCQIPPGP